jgi:ELWxxDGT repeat protein
MLSRTSFRRLGSGLPRRRQKTNRRRCNRLHPACRQLRLEPLEDRTLLAGAVGDAALVADIIPGATSSDPYGLADVNGTLYFGARAPSGDYGLYKSDGTPGGTVLLRENTFPTDFIQFDGSVFFGAATSLGKTDGTSGGTVIVKEGVGVGQMTPVGGSLFFSGGNNKGHELWISDGTSQGTKMVKDVWSGSTTIKTKGDPACVKRCGGVKVSNSSRPGHLTEFNGMVFFAATTDDGRELWVSDGTGKGTSMVKDLAPGEDSSHPQDLLVFNGSSTSARYRADYGRATVPRPAPSWSSSSPAPAYLPN